MLRNKYKEFQEFMIPAIPYGLFIFLFMMFAMPTSKLANTGFYLLVLVPVMFTLPTLLKETMLKVALIQLSLLVLFWLVLSAVHMDIDQVEKIGKEARHALYVLMFCAALYYTLCVKSMSVKKLIEYIFWVAVIYTVASMAYQYGWQGKAVTTRLYPALRFDSPIYMSIILVVFGISILYGLLSEGKKRPAFLLLLLIIFLLYFYNSRTALVALCCGVPAVVMALNIQSKIKTLLYMSLILLAYVLVSYFYGNLLNRGESYRVDIWLSSLQKAVDCGLLFGCGIAVDSQISIESGRVFQHPHNIYIMHLINTGIFGLISLFLLLVYVCIKGIKSNSLMVFGFMAGLIAFIFDGKDLITNPDDIWLIFWLPLTLVAWEINHNVFNKDAQE